MRDFRIYLFIATGLLVLYVIAEMNRPKPVDWKTTSLSDDDKRPFGTYIMHQRLKDIFPGSNVTPYREPIYNVINDHGIQHAGYVLITDYVNINGPDYDKLVKYIKAGNQVFISAFYLGDTLSKKLHTNIEMELTDSAGFEAKSGVDTKLMNRSLDTSYAYTFDKGICGYYFNKLDTTKAIVLGKNNYGHCNFVKYPMGKGALFLNANPLLFSNYALLKKQGARYASSALSYMEPTDSVLWDEYYTRGRAGEENTMRVFLRNEPLRWAFRIAFFSLIIFVFYEMKRRQRIIPIIEPLKNASLDFVNVVGQVYYEQHNNQNIAQKKITYFLEHLRSKYYLKTNPLDDEFTERFVQKTGVERSLAIELVGQIIHLSKPDRVTDSDLILLNRLIQQFYNQVENGRRNI
ncbi:MAG TPA: DUF4350 domain-containing protein [Mucilaginibacter sp.]|jgi:hypothetical protein|nr:DUF4350 domain-containing protein [Mucilaginibacter sp.]